MGRAALVLLAGLALGVPAASSRAATDWKSLKYFDYVSQHLVVATDAAWTRGRVVAALPNQRNLPISGPGLRETNPKWIWATTCGSSAQFVSFVRQILAPGVPAEGSVDFTLGFGRDLPFRSGAFLVNGAEIARIVVVPGKLSGFSKTFSEALPPKALKAFGMNTLTIRAERKDLPKGQRCNSPNRLVGVAAFLKLRFRPDLVALPPPLGLEQVVRTAAGEAKGALGTITFRNVGPSGSPGASSSSTGRRAATSSRRSPRTRSLSHRRSTAARAKASGPARRSPRSRT